MWHSYTAHCCVLRVFHRWDRQGWRDSLSPLYTCLNSISGHIFIVIKSGFSHPSFPQWSVPRPVHFFLHCQQNSYAFPLSAVHWEHQTRRLLGSSLITRDLQPGHCEDQQTLICEIKSAGWQKHQYHLLGFKIFIVNIAKDIILKNVLFFICQESHFTHFIKRPNSFANTTPICSVALRKKKDIN